MVRWSLLLAMFLSVPARADEPRAKKPPNIIVIMADDLGFSDVGCYGSEIATPNLDGLAKQGVRFTQFYNTARCCPSRASLMTGLYSHQAGVGHMNEDRHLPAYIGRLNERCMTIGEVLREGGYRTLMSGKWHLGGPPHSPADRGFEQSFAAIGGSFHYFRPDPKKIILLNREVYTPDPEKFYLTDAITDHAVSFIGDPASKERPFFLYVAYTSPHWPLHAWPEDIAKYRGKYMTGWQRLREMRYRRMIELGIVKADWPLTPMDKEAEEWDSLSEEEKKDRDLRMAVYAAQIDRMDQNIGRILQELRRIGAEENTLIMFLSDNGGCAEHIEGKPAGEVGSADSFKSYGLPWANMSNTPFRLYKHWVHEGGIATPFIAHWPAVIKPGSITDQAGHIIDVMATCVDAAKVEYPREYRGAAVIPLEGKSLLPIFEGRTRPGHEAIFWEHEGNRAVRRGKWKLVSRHPRDWALYDLDADRTEMKDLSGEHPEKVKELITMYDAWAKRAGVVPWSELVGK